MTTTQHPSAPTGAEARETALPTVRRRRKRRDWGRSLARVVCIVLAIVGLVPFAATLAVRSTWVRTWAARETEHVLREQGIVARLRRRPAGVAPRGRAHERPRRRRATGEPPSSSARAPASDRSSSRSSPASSPSTRSRSTSRGCISSSRTASSPTSRCPTTPAEHGARPRSVQRVRGHRRVARSADRRRPRRGEQPSTST